MLARASDREVVVRLRGSEFVQRLSITITFADPPGWGVPARNITRGRGFEHILSGTLRGDRSSGGVSNKILGVLFFERGEFGMERLGRFLHEFDNAVIWIGDQDASYLDFFLAEC